MKLLVLKKDVMTVKLDDGRIVIVGEKDFTIKDGFWTNKCKVGYDDAEIMSLTLKEIFKPELEELNKLRKEKEKHTIHVKCSTMVINSQ